MYIYYFIITLLLFLIIHWTYIYRSDLLDNDLNKIIKSVFSTMSIITFILVILSYYYLDKFGSIAYPNATAYILILISTILYIITLFMGFFEYLKKYKTFDLFYLLYLFMLLGFVFLIIYFGYSIQTNSQIIF